MGIEDVHLRTYGAALEYRGVRSGENARRKLFISRWFVGNSSADEMLSHL